MQLEDVRKRIQQAVAEEQEGHQIAEALEGLAILTGRRPSPQQIDECGTFVLEYVEHVPLLMKSALRSARRAGVGDEMEQVLQAACAYWSEPDDVVPDHLRLGLLGVMDDAYYSLCLIQAVADHFRQKTGKPLLPQDFTAANRAIRAMIGEPFASMLDARIAAALGQPDTTRWIDVLAAAGRPVVYNDPIWGNASIDEIVTARLGAMGVV